MLDEGVLCLYELNFILIGLLPIVFFKRGGTLNILWWLTAAPFIVCPLFLVALHLGLVPGPDSGFPASWRRLLAAVSVLPSVASIALIGFTLGTHRIPIALWHQQEDAPKNIVTWGAYRRIRHPFYAAFLLTLLGAVIFCPHPATLLTFLMGLGILNRTAAREERRLSHSSLGSEYVAYMAHTGRFVPRWSR